MEFFDKTYITESLLEIDNNLFKKGQDSLQQDLELFVSAFEDSNITSSTDSTPVHITADKLTNAFIQLNTCHSQLEIAKRKQEESDQILTELKVANQQVKQLQTVISSQEQRNDIILSPLMEKKQRYMEEMKQRRLDRDREIQRKHDQLEEYYAKRIHESTYKNLVGSTHWLQGQQRK